MRAENSVLVDLEKYSRLEDCFCRGVIETEGIFKIAEEASSSDIGLILELIRKRMESMGKKYNVLGDFYYGRDIFGHSAQVDKRHVSFGDKIASFRRRVRWMEEDFDCFNSLYSFKEGSRGTVVKFLSAAMTKVGL